MVVVFCIGELIVLRRRFIFVFIFNPTPDVNISLPHSFFPIASILIFKVFSLSFIDFTVWEGLAVTVEAPTIAGVTVEAPAVEAPTIAGVTVEAPAIAGVTVEAPAFLLDASARDRIPNCVGGK